MRRFPGNLYMLVFSLIAAALPASHTGQNPSERSDVPSKDTLQAASLSYAPSIVPVRLGQPESVSDYDLEDHLFGKFYGDRAGFYIIKNPDNRIFGHKVHSITLYYLDGKLYKTKYVVNDNLVNDLINIYPQFKIRGFDESNRSILKKEAIFYRIKKKWFLNDNLSNYDIHWKVGESDMRLRINKYSGEEPYQYIIKNGNYEKALAKIENQE